MGARAQATTTGLEPAISTVTGWRDNQLLHAAIFFNKRAETLTLFHNAFPVLWGTVATRAF